MTEQDSPFNDAIVDLELRLEFPSAIDAFVELARYIQVVDEFIAYSSAQRSVRIQARLKREEDPVHIAELEFDLGAVEQEAAVTLPRILWGGILVSIYAAFEHGVCSALRHWQKTTGHPTQFQARGKNFLKRADDYAKSFVGVPLFSVSSMGETIRELEKFRHSFAHGSGLVLDLPKGLQTAIQKQKHPGAAIQTVEGQWIANARSAEYYLVHSERITEQFGNAVLEECLIHRRM